MDSLTGKVALVTGGNRGIGAAISTTLAQAGCDVAVNFRNRAEEAEPPAPKSESLAAARWRSRPMFHKSGEVQPMIARIEKELGAVNILVNNPV